MKDASLFIVAALLLFFNLFLSIFYYLFRKNNGKKIIYSFASIICCLLVLLCWSNQIHHNLGAVVASYVLYMLLVFVIKCICTLVLFGRFSHDYKYKERTEEATDAFFSKCSLFLISPDYGATCLCKDIIWKTRDDVRKRQIECFNYLNLIFSFLGVVLSCTFGKLDKDILKTLNFFLVIRVISRTIEIMTSFVLDVCSNERQSSTLDWHDRIILAFLSLVEIVILAFNVGFSSSIECGADISKAAKEALLVVNSLGDEESLKEWSGIAKLFCGLASFSLIGIVISSYLGRRKSYYDE